MSRTRVAELHRQLAEIHRELADELTREDAPRSVPVEKRKTKRKPLRNAFVPTRQFTDIEIARARQRAKKLGIPVS